MHRLRLFALKKKPQGFPSEGKLSPQATDEVVFLAYNTSSGASRHLPLQGKAR